ncbi:hypothetical protein M1D72_01365 [Vibrio sp. AK197]
MDKKEMVILTIASLIGGRKEAAAELGMTKDIFENHLYERNGSRFFSVDQLLELADITQTPFVAQYFAEQCGYFLVQQPKATELDSEDMFDCHIQLNAVKGLLDKTVHEAAKDGVFDSKERKLIHKLKNRYQSTFEGFMLKLDRLYAGVR